MEGFNWQQIVIGMLAASGIAAWASAWLTSKSPNTAVQFIKDILNLIGGNVWKGTNADDDRV